MVLAGKFSDRKNFGLLKTRTAFIEAVIFCYLHHLLIIKASTANSFFIKVKADRTNWLGYETRSAQSRITLPVFGVNQKEENEISNISMIWSSFYKSG